MSITLSLNPETEKTLSARAGQLGLSLNDLLQELANREAAALSEPMLSGGEKAKAFLAWADSFPDTPPLSDDAISRESLYPDRW
ncbi:MAG: hypothetical protein NTW74_12925 [Acidobacteria bacterium]|nr:hypothetical protein [Acidobacteriota bacterium]